MRGQSLSNTVPAHRMCQALFIFVTFSDAALHPDKGQVLSSTVPAHRMCQVLLQFFHFGMLPHTQIRGQVVSSTVPAHRMCQELLHFFSFMDAGLHQDEGSNTLKHRACAQNVSDVTHSLYFLGG
jgi:hypothetical protein